MASNQSAQKYRLLGSGDDETSDTSLGRLYEGDRPLARCKRSPWKSVPRVTAMVISGIIGGFALGYAVHSSRCASALSPYMRLATDHSDTLWWTTLYSNETASDSELNELWDTQIPWESGIVALKNEEARALNLPESQPFPWDASRKSLYIVNAHHVLHCVVGDPRLEAAVAVRNLYISIQQYRTNTPQTINYPHILHCLDTLRLETMCTADDTLRYVPLNSAHGYRPGDGQPRMCRDWDRVREFVESHDPCYRYLKPGDTELSNLERFKFCSENSEYLPKIRKYFKYDAGWTPEPQEGPRELVW
ncbi:hypothetical protein ONZ43_g6465 [Nemania bipapillata]|uniref:Uncharacterized protein n=1 Tax=Nemania bipapillata TaxID=110536 RepID=A0ACC2HZ72_9PEZI|nr:hypothetical protein ONZ43_g6465 [Nemania bipapillata]